MREHSKNALLKLKEIQHLEYMFEDCVSALGLEFFYAKCSVTKYC